MQGPGAPSIEVGFWISLDREVERSSVLRWDGLEPDGLEPDGLELDGLELDGLEPAGSR